MQVWLNVITTLAAAVIGGIVAPQLTQAKERRAARAEVREKLAAVEGLRWSDESNLDYRRAVTELEAKAILARLRRADVRAYVDAASAAREKSYVVDVGPDGGPDCLLETGPESEAVEKALDRLSVLLWHPWASRFSLRRRRLQR